MTYGQKMIKERQQDILEQREVNLMKEALHMIYLEWDTRRKAGQAAEWVLLERLL